MKLRIASALTIFLTLGWLTAEDTVLDEAEQKALTPEAVLADLQAGNKRFVAGESTNGENIKEEVEATAHHQYPQAIILSCIDSRVPVEEVFDQNIGDVFVARVAGNVENEDILGSMEYATKKAGAKLIMVLGHESCGAVKGACDHLKLGNLTGLLDKIEPAVEAVQDEFEEDQRNSKSEEFVHAVARKNVELTIADIRASSPVIAALEEEGAIAIVGAMYDIHTGKVALLGDEAEEEEAP